MTSPDLSVALPRPIWLGLTPALFVLLWSTGFIGAKLGLPFAGPMSFLALRFLSVSALMLGVSVATAAPWPANWRAAAHIAVVGALLQGTYLGGVFIGISTGVSAGLAALIVGLQPVLTGLLAGLLLRERIAPRQWAGLVLGFLGVALVGGRTLAPGGAPLLGVGAIAAALLGITLGTLYQKRFCAGMDLRSGTVIQNGVAAAMMLPGAILLERFRIEWSAPFLFALVWLILVLSIGATLLLFVLLRRGAASRVAGLFYMVPPMTALIAYLLFGESLGPVALLGMGVAVLGVALVTWPQSERA